MKQIKKFGLYLLAGLLVISTGLWRYEHYKLNRCTNSKVDLEGEIAGLRQSIASDQALIADKDQRIKEYEIGINVLQDSIAVIKARQKVRENGYVKEIEALKKIPVDSSYTFLTDAAYPYPGELKFPFNEMHVRSFHGQYIRNVFLEGSLADIGSALGYCEETGIMQGKVITEYAKKELNYKAIIAAQDSMQMFSASKIFLLQEDVKKQKNKKVWWRRGFFVLAGYTLYKGLQ